MNTLEDFWQRFRCADTYHMPYDEMDKLEALVRAAGPSDVEYLKVILPRILRGFKHYYEETRPMIEELARLKEQVKTSPCLCSVEKESS